MKNHWTKLPMGYVVAHGWTRYRRGARRYRFLLLGPQESPGALRPTCAAGDIMGGKCVVDHGVLGPAFAEQIARVAIGRIG